MPGLKSIYGIASNATFEANEGVRYDHEPAQRGALPNEEDWDTRSYLRHMPTVFEAVRNEFGPELPLLHDGHHRMTPIQAAKLGKSLEPYDLFWLEDFTPAENHEALRLVRQHTTTPLAIGEIFNTVWDYQQIIREQLIDYVRSAVTHTGGITHLKKVLDYASQYQIKSGMHGPTDISPVGMAAAMHLGLSIHNFGIQEYMKHGREDRPGVRAVVHLEQRHAPPRRQARARRRAEPGRGGQVPLRAGLPALQPPRRRHGARLVTASSQRAAPVVVVMGVSGSGKSTIGALLARDLGVPFTDADDLHPLANIEKMASGVPLDDDDRRPWLEVVGATLADAAERAPDSSSPAPR